ncbi:hypothetical protein LNP74_26735 [Klebsiella pneumoniae subsp. pneumoniae]|nr:hypothetical protein [Klebsiella pneumoniae subsp. pneumoniae]
MTGQIVYHTGRTPPRIMNRLCKISVNQPGFLFHDYETFGTSPSLDRPAQFAAIRTDAELNVLGEPGVFSLQTR